MGKFDTVEVRSYPRILGDNPTVSAGAPITLDWTWFRSFSCDLEKFEHKRQTSCLRRERKELIVPRSIRKHWCLNAGSTISEIAAVLEQCNVDIANRRASAAEILRKESRRNKNLASN